VSYTKSKENKMKKLNELISIWIDGRTVRGVKLTLAMFNELYAISRGYTDVTISSEVKAVLDKCGIKTKTEGIGWRIIR
jgi:hypothetical protein